MKPPLGEEAASGMDLKREGANISLAIKYLKGGGRGFPSVFDLTFCKLPIIILDQIVLSSNTPRSSI